MSRRSKIGIAVALALLAAGLFTSQASPPQDVQVVISITNQHRFVKTINLGESRWSGAAYELYRKGEHLRAVASANSGDSVLVARGTYDIKVIYSDGRKAQEKWISDVSIPGQYQRSIELNVPESELGTQKVQNTWEPY